MTSSRFTINNGNNYLMNMYRSNYNRYNAYNQTTPYIMNLYQQRYGFMPFGMGQQQQTFEVKTSFGEELGTMVGTLERNNPGTLKKFYNWAKDTAAPAIGKAAKWVWNGIAGLFSKKSASVEEA